MSIVETIKHTGAVVCEIHHVTLRSQPSHRSSVCMVPCTVDIKTQMNDSVHWCQRNCNISILHKSSTFSEAHHWNLATGTE